MLCVADRKRSTRLNIIHDVLLFTRHPDRGPMRSTTGGDGVWGDGEGVWRVMRGEVGGGEVVERVEEACEREREEGRREEGSLGGGEFGKSGKREKENGDICVFVDAVWGCCAWAGGREETLMEVRAWLVKTLGLGVCACCGLILGGELVGQFSLRPCC